MVGSHARLAATEAQGRIVALQVEVVLGDVFDDAQMASLREAAESCRISRALNVPVSLRLTSGPTRPGVTV